MKRDLILLIVGIAGFLLCCSPVDKKAIADVRSDVASSDSLLMLKAYCYACHNPAAPSHDNLLAPPMAAVKFRYLRRYPQKTEFVSAMVNFLREPKEHNAIMFGAVDQFGLMPAMALDEAKAREIVTYIYNNELETPGWFQGHSGNRNMSR